MACARNPVIQNEEKGINELMEVLHFVMWWEHRNVPQCAFRLASSSLTLEVAFAGYLGLRTLGALLCDALHRLEK